MRLVQLITRRQRRGAEVFAAELSTALAVHGHTIHFAGLTPPPTEPLAPPNVVCDDVSQAPQSLLSPRIVLDLARYLRRTNPDVIQANGGYALKYAVLAKRLYRLPHPIVYRNIGLSSDWLRRSGQKVWAQWIMRGIAASASVSTASRNDLVATYGVEPSIATVIRRGVPVEAVEISEARCTLRLALGVPEEAPLLLHVGSFTPEKNHAGLLRIVARVRAAHPGAHLALVGDGPLRPEVAREAGRQGAVHLLGLRDDVPHLMAGADLLLLPSHTEGIPGVILEAGVQSLPAVAYAIGGVAEAVRDGETGRLIPPGDEAAFAEAVAALLAAPERRAALGRAARALIASEYALDRSVDAFERLYRQIVAA